LDGGTIGGFTDPDYNFLCKYNNHIGTRMEQFHDDNLLAVFENGAIEVHGKKGLGASSWTVLAQTAEAEQNTIVLLDPAATGKIYFEYRR
jgi:hypothetical protein